jgi:hypothetical protein
VAGLVRILQHQQPLARRMDHFDHMSR